MMKKTLTGVALTLFNLSLMAQGITLRQDNIDDVLSQLTLQEKASLVVVVGYKSRGQYIDYGICLSGSGAS